MRQQKRQFSFLKAGKHAVLLVMLIQLSENAEDCGCDFTKGSRCDDFSQLWYPFESKLSASSLSYISELPEFITFDYANKKNNSSSRLVF
jgi:hypothetical protein